MIPYGPVVLDGGWLQSSWRFESRDWCACLQHLGTVQEHRQSMAYHLIDRDPESSGIPSAYEPAQWALDQIRDVEPNEHGSVWPSRQTGGVLTRVHDLFVAAVDASGVRPFNCHDLRTTGATWLRDAGVDELVIALLLGHRSTFDPVAGSFHAPSTNVTRSYTRVYETALREAVAVFDAIRNEIDPLAASHEQIDERFESGIESLEVPQELNYWSSGSDVVAHTGFEPVLPP